MSDTVDYGIDLGTTNSAAAMFVDGEPVVVKNNDGWDFTPSAVWMPKVGTLSVGRRAREHAERDPENAHVEFKLEMGMEGAVRGFANAGVSLTPPELSAEVLKSLRADAAHQYGQTPVAAVITVPAAFRLHQNRATEKAAELAGFTSCALLQEPTAAAFAYGLNNATSEAYWMVFDFGGGTFDAAVVCTVEGELRVLDHAGDPHLGGKRVDWAIVDRLLAPAAARELGLAEFTRDNRAWRRNFAVLKWAAEQAKIDLSRTGQADIFVDLEIGDKQTDTFTYTLRREDLDTVAEPFYVQAINLCRDALKKANLDHGDIDRLLLVGGMTLSPGLRELLADPTEGLGIALDHSQDPTTAVARGAAVYASTLPRPADTPVPVAGEFAVELDYPRATSLTEVVVTGRFHSAARVDWTAYRVVLDNPNGRPPFQTPQVALDASGAFAAEVHVDELTTSTFTVTLLNSHGVRERVTPETISIRHWTHEHGGQVLTNSLGLTQADGAFVRMLTKGTRLPATAHGPFLTTVPLRRTDTDAVIRIPIVEGERDRGDRNMQVGVIEIRPKDVRLNLPQGSEVDITFEVDESRRVTVVADVPLVDAQFEAEINLDSVTPPDPADLRRELLDVERRCDRLRESAERSGSDQARSRLEQLDAERMLEQVRDEVKAASVDNGSAAAADDRLRAVQALLDDVENDVRLPGLHAELLDTIELCRELVGRLGDADDRSELAELDRLADRAGRDGDAAAIVALTTRAENLRTLMLRRDGTLELSVFYWFRNNEHVLTSRERARELIEEGEGLVAANDWSGLPGVNQRLRRLLPADAPDPQGGVRQAGLGRRT